MASRGQLVVRYTGDTKGIDKANKDVKSKFGKFGKAAKFAAKAAAVGVAAVVAGIAVVGKKLIEAGERASTSNARVQQVFKSMGQFGDQATKVAGRVTKLSDAMARKTGIDQNEVKQGAAIISTFSNISKSADKVGGTFDRTLGLATDLSAAGFGSVDSAATMLGKALQDPTKGLTALNRVGVSFTAGQKKQIEAMQKAGDVAGAQKIILKAVESQVGGVAAATANATDRMKVSWSQVQERLGLKLMPVLDEFANWFIASGLPVVEKFGGKVVGVFGRIVPAITGFRDLIAKGDFTSKLGKALGVSEDSKLIDGVLKLRGGVLAMVAAFKDGGTDITSSGFAGAMESIGLAARNLWDAVGPVASRLGPPIMQIVSAFSPLGMIVKILTPILPRLAAALGKVAEAIAGALAAAAPVIAKVVEGIANLAVWVVRLVAPLLENERLVKILIGAYLAWKGVMVGTAIAQLAMAGAQKAVAIGMKVMLGVQKAATAAQWLLNAAMSANPIALIVIAIAALVAGLVWFFTKTKLGKKIWKGFTDFLGTAFEKAGKVISAVWGWIKDAAGKAWDWIKKYVVQPIRWYIGILVKVFQFYGKIGKAVWRALSRAIGTAWDWLRKNVFAKLRRWIDILRIAFGIFKEKATEVWGKIRRAIGKVYGWLKDNVFSKIQRWIRILRIAFGILRERIADIWAKIRSAIGKVYAWIRDNVFSRIRRWIRILRVAFGILRERISDVWGKIKGKIRGVWEWIRDNVFNKLRAFIRDTVPDAFKNGVAKITSFWDKIRKAASKPVKFVADTVYNKGIRKVINYVIDLVGGSPLPKWKPYAQGGYTGPGAKMQPAGVVHADEFVMSKSARRGLESAAPGALDFMNKTGRWPGYAGGGLVDAAKWWTARGARASEHPAFGGVRGGHMKGSLHYSGNAVDLNYGPSGQNPTEMAFFDRLIGVFKSKFPNLGVLWRTAGHFNHMHVDTGGRSAGGGGGGGILGFLDKLRDLKGGLAAGVGGSGFGKMMGRAGNWLINGPLNWAKSKADPLREAAGDLFRGASSRVTDTVKNIASSAFGWGGSQWNAIREIVGRESSWNPSAANPTSSARGLFQKMTGIHGAVEKTVAGQANWGLNYIQSRYGNPVNALKFWDRNGWYANGGLVKVPKFDNGGTLGRGLNLVNNATGAPETLHRTPPRDDRPIHIHLEIGGRDMGTIIVDTVRREVRKNGGNVQATLGRGR